MEVMSMSGDVEASKAIRGGYRPVRPIQGRHPLFQWPPKPKAGLIWLFGFPGYLWPWQAFFICLAVASWFFFTPRMEKMQTFSMDWVAILLVQNMALLVAFVSVWHVWLYVVRAQGTEYKYNSKWLSVGNPTFFFRSQLWDNIFWNLCSAVPIWTAYEAVTFWLQANHIVPTVNWQTHPIYCSVLILLTPIWSDIHFYATHRLIHWRPLYRLVHSLHHKNINVGPWSGLAMHPVEHLVYFSSVLLFWIIPSHPVHALTLLQTLALGAAMSHHGFDRVALGDKRSFSTDHYIHYLHHKYVSVNFSTGTLPLDLWLGTFHDGSDEAQEALKSRARRKAGRADPQNAQ